MNKNSQITLRLPDDLRELFDSYKAKNRIRSDNAAANNLIELAFAGTKTQEMASHPAKPPVPDQLDERIANIEARLKDLRANLATWDDVRAIVDRKVADFRALHMPSKPAALDPAVPFNQADIGL